LIFGQQKTQTRNGRHGGKHSEFGSVPRLAFTVRHQPGDSFFGPTAPVYLDSLPNTFIVCNDAAFACAFAIPAN
jgi:hypothetical protein